MKQRTFAARYYGHSGRSGYECMLADAPPTPAASAKVCAASRCPWTPDGPRRACPRGCREQASITYRAGSG